MNFLSVVIFLNKNSSDAVSPNSLISSFSNVVDIIWLKISCKMFLSRFSFKISGVSLVSFIYSIKSWVDIFSLLIFATLFVFPPLNTLPIPQKTKGMIIIAINNPANLLLEKFLSLPSIIKC